MADKQCLSLHAGPGGVRRALSERPYGLPLTSYLLPCPDGERRAVEGADPYERVCCLLPVACCLVRAGYGGRSVSAPTAYLLPLTSYFLPCPGGERRAVEGADPYERVCCLLPVACCLVRAGNGGRSVSAPTAYLLPLTSYLVRAGNGGPSRAPTPTSGSVACCPLPVALSGRGTAGAQ